MFSENGDSFLVSLKLQMDMALLTEGGMLRPIPAINMALLTEGAHPAGAPWLAAPIL